MEPYLAVLVIMIDKAIECYDNGDMKEMSNYLHQVAVIAEKIAQDAKEEAKYTGY